MQLATHHLGLCAAVIFALTSLLAVPAWPGGSGDEDSHDPKDDGPSYFGFVRDASGKAIGDAKVTAEIKGLGSVITRSNATGVYKLPGFGKHILPNNVTISCAKDGYKQTRTLRRTPPSKQSVAAIEVECTLQRVAGK